MVQQVATSTEYDTLINSNPIVLVDFFAVWCGPCKMVAPVLDKMEEEYKAAEKKVKFLKVDVDQMRDLSVKLGIAAMPTFMIYQDGVVKKTIVGADVAQIKATIDELTAIVASAEEPVAV